MSNWPPKFQRDWRSTHVELYEYVQVNMQEPARSPEMVPLHITISGVTSRLEFNLGWRRTWLDRLHDPGTTRHGACLEELARKRDARCIALLACLEGACTSYSGTEPPCPANDIRNSSRLAVSARHARRSRKSVPEMLLAHCFREPKGLLTPMARWLTSGTSFGRLAKRLAVVHETSAMVGVFKGCGL